MSDDERRAPLVAGVDIGGTSIKWMLVDEDGGIEASGREATRPAQIIDQARGIVRSLVERHPGIRGIGATCPGIVDEPRGVVLFASNLDLRDAPLRAALAEASGRPTALIHDGRAAGIAEGLFGSGRGADSFAMIPIGTGISAALMLGGELWAGSAFCAGEIGHSPVFPDGETCACGQRGCLEAYASANGLKRRYFERTGRMIGAREIELNLETDADARAVWETATTALGIAIAQMTLSLDPARFIIGGGLAGAGETLLGPMRAAAAARLEWRPLPEVVAAELGPSAGRWGGAVAAARAAGSECYEAWSVASARGSG